MKINEALIKATKILNTHADSPRKEASMLLAKVLQKDRMWLFLHEDDELKNVELYEEYVKRRVNGEPLEYILGMVSFYSRDFIINEGVLIPRPETELLVDIALDLIKDIKNPKIVEVGVGSGIVSSMLAILREDVNIIATDISLTAIQNAKQNFEKFEISNKITLKHTSLLNDVEGNFDLLVSNPPYISQKEKLEEHVLKEPHLALFGGEKGDELLKQIIFTCKDRNIRYLACEMGYDQKESMTNELKKNEAKNIKFYKDLASLDRGFWARF